jgi:alkaline phosphatase D
MSTLREAGLGPIVGHTSSTSCRLWIRAKDPADKGSSLSEDRRTIGVITVLDRGRPVPNDPRRSAYFRLHREYDRTGTFNLGVDSGIATRNNVFVLKPNSSYQIRMGTMALDDARDNEVIVDDEELARRLPPASVWAEDLMKLESERTEASFHTFPQQSNALSFMMGSCHYPGLFWKKKHSDRIFGPMCEQLEIKRYGKSPGFVLMVGDQIYADMFNRLVPIGLADTFKEFQDRYRGAFGSPNIRKLLRSVANYMILDDHEIEDNWTQDRIAEDRKKRVLFNLAIGAYMSYQWCHGPRSFGNRLYYSFDYAGFPFFVLDERTQRFKNDAPGLDDNHLLGRPSFDPVNEPAQIDRLLQWLSAHKDDDRPKFIVTPTVFVPNPIVTTISEPHKEKSDSWPAFPTTRRLLLNHIIQNKIQNVVFLSGDIHCSNVARINFSGSPEVKTLKAFSITSSAFYWPYPFADGEPSNYVHDSIKQDDEFVIDAQSGIKMNYRASNFTQEDNFCRVDVNWPKRRIEVRTIDQKGNNIVKSILKLAG